MNNKKAIIVDDDQKITMIIEKALEQMGFQVFSTDNGKKAFQFIIEQKPDLLVTDILQPGMDGVQLGNRIKSEPALQHIKIILISGVFNFSTIKLQMEYQPDAFYEKPIDINKFINTVERVFNPPEISF